MDYERLKKIIDQAKSVTLSKKERNHIREKIYNFMEANPAKEIKKGSERLSAFLRTPAMALASILILVTVAGGSLTYAAEGSIPGDILYPVKIRINEKVRTRLARSDISQAHWEIEKAERRLEEIEELALRNNVDPEIIVTIENNFEEHASRVYQRIAEFELRNRTEDAAEISSNFETSLRAHEKILDSVLKTESPTEGRPFLLKVRASKNTASRARIKVEDAISVREEETTLEFAARERMEDVAEEIEQAQKSLEHPTEDISSPLAVSDLAVQNEAENLENLVDIAEILLEQGKEKLEEKSYKKAFILFQNAHRAIREYNLIISNSQQLDISTDFDTRHTIKLRDCRYPILESFPRQCKTPSGTFIIEEDIK